MKTAQPASCCHGHARMQWQKGEQEVRVPGEGVLPGLSDECACHSPLLRLFTRRGSLKSPESETHCQGPRSPNHTLRCMSEPCGLLGCNAKLAKQTHKEDKIQQQSPLQQRNLGSEGPTKVDAHTRFRFDNGGNSPTEINASQTQGHLPLLTSQNNGSQ